MAQPTDLTGMLTEGLFQPTQKAVPSSYRESILGAAQSAGTGLRRGIGALTGADTMTNPEAARVAMQDLDINEPADQPKILEIVRKYAPEREAALVAQFAQQGRVRAEKQAKQKQVLGIRSAVVNRIKDDPRYVDILPAVQQGLFDGNPEELAKLLKRETVKGIKLGKPFAGKTPAGDPVMLTIKSEEGKDDVIVDLAGEAPPLGTVLSTEDGTKVEVNLSGETQDAFSKELGKGLAKDLIDSRNKAATSLLTADVLNNQWKLVSEGLGVISGTGTNILLGVGKALVAGGLLSGEGKDLIANTEDYLANAGNLVAEVITAFGAGTGLSDQDRKFAIAMAAGDPAVLTEEGIKRILKLQAKITKFKIEQHNKKVADSPASDSVYDMTVNVPEFPWAADIENGVQYPEDVSELINKYTTKRAGG